MHQQNTVKEERNIMRINLSLSQLYAAVATEPFRQTRGGLPMMAII